MKSTFENGVLTIFYEGTIDTNNAEQFGADVAEARTPYADAHLVLDAEKLSYISSAGLRQILKLKKSDPEFKIINVNADVYDVFDMTGFSEMMTIEKAYRTLSIEGCEKIGEGSNGVVYQLNSDTIIKIYKNNDALSDILRERELARKALVMGVNTAISYDVVKVGDKFGSVFEMVNAKSITKWFKADPDNKPKYVKVMVDLLHEIHNTHVKDGALPSEKQVVLNWVKYLENHIDAEHYNKLLKLVEEVPETDTMIHGDYHSGNVHYDQKEAILIDMDTIAVGHPIFEIASVYNAYQGYGIVNHTDITNFIGMEYDDACYLWQQIVKDYYNVEDITDIENKAKVIGLTRVLRRTLRRSPDNALLINESKRQLLEAIDKVDTLL